MATTSITDAIVLKIEIAAPPERVFQALTDPAELMRWFKSSDCPPKLWQMDARLGGGYIYATDKSEKKPIHGVHEFECHGEILEFEPPRVLAYTWIANWHTDPQRNTVVRWELTPSEKGTIVKVIHSGLAEEAVARKDYSGGWPGVLTNLKKFAEQVEQRN